MLFGIFIYEDVEPIDLATFGVLSMARRIRPDIALCTIAPEAGPLRLANGLRVIPDYALDDAPPVDVLVVTGGAGWTAQAAAPATLAFLRRRAAAGTRVASVCTGAMILAAAGLLDGRQATTKRETVPPETPPIQRLRTGYPAVAACEASLVDDGGIVTGGGVSLCIDTMLHLLKKLAGAETAAETARIIEYQRAWAANLEQFPPVLPATP